ncbi:MAG: MFS transporter, partial [Planctomycetaceae bacterium]|nr:MFS transporter [Planctomycetaceae bacterium]
SESARLNRLIIEGMFRDSIKKLYVTGWRPMMFVYGALGLLVAGLIWWSCRTTPDQHPWCNAAEIALINGNRPLRASTGKVSSVPIKALMQSRSMWSSCISQWFTNIGWVFLLTWAPRYLTNVHHLPTELRALLVSIPPLVGWAGMLSGGWVTDRAVERLGLRWGRVLPISLSRFVAMAAYLGCLFEPSATLAVVLFSVVAFSTDFGTPSMWAFTQDVGGRYVGSVLGWGNMWGNLGAAVTPPFLIWVIGATENWNYAFVTCAAAFLLSGLFALGIDARVPIVVDDDLLPDPQQPNP